MNCVKHPQTDSVAFCGHCGRALCTECKHEVRGMIYCEDCLASRLVSPGLSPFIGAGVGPSPGVALAVGFIPGVGSIYNGQIMKAIIQVLLFGSLIALSDRIPGPMDTIFGLGAAAFYFYMVIDSYQTARAKALGQPVPEWFGMGDMKLNAPIGAAVLIGIGSLFLLDNFGIHVFEHIGKFWPVLLIAVGVMMLQRRGGGGGTPPRSGPDIPGAPPQGPTNIPGPHGL